MDSTTFKSLTEAYYAVYDEDLRSELQEDLSFIDTLNDEELDQVMETVLVSGEINIDECFESFEYVLSEAKVTSSENRPTGSAKVTTSAERPSRVARTTERQRQVRIGRLAQATKRAGQKLASPARGGSGTSVSKRVGQVSQKVKSAAEKVKGFLGKVGRAAKAGYSAAKKELTGQAGKEAEARKTGRQMRRAARNQAAAERGKDTSAFQKPSAPKQKSPARSSIGNVKPGPASRSSATAKKQSPSPSSSERRYPTEPSGQTTLFTSPVKGKSAGANVKVPVGGQKKFGAKRDKKAKVKTRQMPLNLRLNKEEQEFIFQSIAEDLINEGYAYNHEHAFDIIESFSIDELNDLVESYLSESEEIETVDFYDVVMNHLLDEGYAETKQGAEVIMINMSENWRNEIIEATYSAKKARAGKDIGKPGKQFAKIAKEAGKRYGSKERGEKVAGAVLAKLRAKRG